MSAGIVTKTIRKTGKTQQNRAAVQRLSAVPKAQTWSVFLPCQTQLHIRSFGTAERSE
jgi:hypothetical protein